MLNDSDVAVLGTIASVVLFVSNVIFLTLWIRARERALRATRPEKQSSLVRDDIDEMKNAIDSIAVEVERISEGQRFTSKLLAERAQLPVKEIAGRVITPH